MTTGCYTRARAAAIRQPQSPVELSHLIVVVAVTFLPIAAIMVRRGGRRFLEN